MEGLFPQSSPHRMLTDLFLAKAGRSYLIQVNSQSSPLVWKVEGIAALPSGSWDTESYRLIGFHVDPANIPFFETFFEGAEHQDFEVYRLLSSGEWKVISDLATAQIESGRAYWIYSRSHSDFVGPLRVKMEGGSVLNFGNGLSEQSLEIIPLLSRTRLRCFSEGRLPLYFKYPMDSDDQWQRLSAVDPVVLELMDKKSLSMVIGIKRSEMTPTEHESVLVFKEDSGMAIQISVVASKNFTPGLWVGTATIQAVSHPIEGDLLRALFRCRIRLIFE